MDLICKVFQDLSQPLDVIVSNQEPVDTGESVVWHESKSHFTLWPRAVTMNLGGLLKPIRRLSHGKLNLNFVWSLVKCSSKTHAAGLSTECYSTTF